MIRFRSISAVTTGWSLFWGVSVIVISFASFLRGETSHTGGHVVELSDRDRRRPEHRLAFFDIAYHPRLGADLHAVADRQMARHPDLASDHHIIAEPRAAGNADLRDHHTAATDLHVVPDLHQIINHRARADDRVGSRTAIDRCVRTDLDIVDDNDAAELRHLHRRVGIGRETEAVLTDARPGIDAHARADNAVAECRIGRDTHIVA